MLSVTDRREFLWYFAPFRAATFSPNSNATCSLRGMKAWAPIWYNRLVRDPVHPSNLLTIWWNFKRLLQECVAKGETMWRFAGFFEKKLERWNLGDLFFLYWEDRVGGRVVIFENGIFRVWWNDFLTFWNQMFAMNDHHTSKIFPR